MHVDNFVWRESQVRMMKSTDWLFLSFNRMESKSTMQPILQGVGFPSYMMMLSNGNIFRVTGPLWGKFTGHRRIPLTKASDAGL